MNKKFEVTYAINTISIKKYCLNIDADSKDEAKEKVSSILNLNQNAGSLIDETIKIESINFVSITDANEPFKIITYIDHIGNIFFYQVPDKLVNYFMDKKTKKGSYCGINNNILHTDIKDLIVIDKENIDEHI